jgi:hypothetical protein
MEGAFYQPLNPSALEVESGHPVIRKTTGEKKSKHKLLCTGGDLFLKK